MPRLEPWEHTTRQLIPHLSVRILSPSPLLVFPPLYPRRRSRVFSFLSLFLSLQRSCPRRYRSSRSLACPGPFLRSLAAGSSRSRHLGSPCLPLLLSRVHPALMVKLFPCNCVCMYVAHTCSILFSFRLSYHLPSFSLSLSLSSSFFVKHNPRM